MNEEYRRALEEGLRVFASGEYGTHVLSSLDSLIELQEARLFRADSWEAYREDRAKRDAYLRIRRLLRLETDVD